MTRPTDTDDITKLLLERYVAIESELSGWGEKTDTTKAVYPILGFPLPQAPFPAAYIYLAGIRHDWSLLHQGIRRDIYTVNTRIIGGPITSGSVVPSGALLGDMPEIAVYKMINAVQNQLVYTPFLNDPTDGTPFRYVDPNNPSLLGDVGRITGFSYGEQGAYVGIEIPCTTTLLIRLGRL